MVRNDLANKQCWRAAQQRLAAVLVPLATAKRDELVRLKQREKEIERPDFLWHFLLQSFATMGSASGWKRLIDDQTVYRRVAFDELARLESGARRTRLEETLRGAGIRWWKRKSEFLSADFERIVCLGGPVAARDDLLARSGRDGKIAFLKAFHGIGDKYARNLMMDVYHPDFRESIAVDQRIKAITRELGLEFSSYAEHEQFYLEAAHAAGLEGWEVDRLIFNFLPEIFARL